MPASDLWNHNMRFKQYAIKNFSMCLKTELAKVVKKKRVAIFNIGVYSVLYFNLYINLHL